QLLDRELLEFVDPSGIAGGACSAPSASASRGDRAALAAAIAAATPVCLRNSRLLVMSAPRMGKGQRGATRGNCRPGRPPRNGAYDGALFGLCMGSAGLGRSSATNGRRALRLSSRRSARRTVSAAGCSDGIFELTFYFSHHDTSPFDC